MKDQHDFIVAYDHGLVELANVPYRYIEIERPWINGQYRNRYWFIDFDWNDNRFEQWAREEFNVVEIVWQMNLPF